MCDAKKCSLKFHSIICFISFLLCVFLDVHVHASKQDKSAVLIPKIEFIHEHLELVIQKYNASLSNLSDKNSLTLDQFEHLLASLGIEEVEHSHGHKEDHNDHDHEHDHDHDKEHEHGHLDVPLEKAYNTCYTAERMYDSLNKTLNSSLNKNELFLLCPTILYQSVSKACSKPQSEPATKPSRALEVWLFSSITVIVISLVGLVVVAIIPLMHKSFYNMLIQFLIALAVGSLAGDALLHLIPHALFPHEDDNGVAHDHSDHSDAVWKSVVALMGIHLFFFTERLTILCQNAKSKRKFKKERLVMLTLTKEIGDAKISTRAHSHGDQKTSQPCNQPSNLQDQVKCPNSMNLEYCAEQTTSVNQALTMNVNGHNPTRAEDTSKKGTPTHFAANNGEDFHNESTHPLLENSISRDHLSDVRFALDNTDASGDKQVSYDGEVGAGGAVVEASLTHPHKDKPHGHHHGHSHDLSSVKAIAYTIIAGDGLHNFCDGIAIGAAFASDLRGGLSTAIAVLCHELPHELGDFAVLLHAGMAIKTAIFYNLLSSILCAFGMILGVVLGGMPNASSFVFMLTSGMFLYIALVDMMPELSTSRLKGSHLFHRPSMLFIWQNIGFLIGASVMLVIALYEDKII